MSGSLVLLFVAAFFACAVEAVEATTVVLALGVTRGWRSVRRGVGAGLVLLAAVVAAFGPAIARIPLGPLRLVVGALLLVFGLGWLRKAVLRASGFKALHDEDQAFERQRRAAAEAGPEPGAGRPGGGWLGGGWLGGGWLGGDPYSFTLAFKAVVLEGLEVAFIVVTFGANAHDVSLAAVAAAAGVVAVVAVAAKVRAPLSRVPENTIKFAVGVLLSSFGTFWGAEGAGARWPGSDASLIVLIPAVLVFSLAAVALLRRHRRGLAPLAGDPVPAEEVAR